MDDELRDAYLRRLGVERRPPSVDALFELHRAQVEHVPYETLWIHLGERWGIEVSDTVRRVALHGRGGYCFHLNGAFSELLPALGYQVTRHVGGVHGPDGPDEEAMTNHLVLSVSGLPSDGNPAGTWYVDVGLGDALHEPLPLQAGTYRQGPFTLSLEETPGGVGDWHLTHDPAGTFPGMAWRSAPADIGAFRQRHEWLSTSPESGFVKLVCAQRRDATGVDVLRGLAFTRVGGVGGAHDIESKGEFVEVLGDTFRLDLAAADPVALEELWARLRASHEAWVAAGRP
jgi:N-hydroxyarylamine O-acetyltransferase